MFQKVFLLPKWTCPCCEGFQVSDAKLNGVSMLIYPSLPVLLDGSHNAKEMESVTAMGPLLLAEYLQVDC